MLIKARIEKQSLAGEAIPLRVGAATGEISFRAEHGRRHPEENTALAGIEGKDIFTGLTSLH